MSPKEACRETIKRHLRTIPKEEFHLQGAKAAALLCPSPLWLRYDAVFLFLSMDSEIDTLPLLQAALQEGKKVFAPRVQAQKLVFCRMRSPDWRKGPFGIREPLEEEAAEFPALILTPALAFDREGNRLGRGGGYYDRFFAELDKDRKDYSALGLCLDSQIINRIPVMPHDRKVDGILTGTALYQCLPAP